MPMFPSMKNKNGDRQCGCEASLPFFGGTGV
jgi:hypothetical protein